MSKRAWLTPNSIPVRTVCRVVRIPDDPAFVYAFSGALLSLTEAQNWEEFGELTPTEAAEACLPVVLDYLESSVCMIGTILPFATSEPPAATLLCDGTQYARVDYPALYDAILPGLQVDSDFFVVPDLRDRFVVGAGARNPLDIGGAEEITLTEAQMPIHSHLYTPPTLNIDLEGPGAPDILAAGIGLPTQTGNAGGNQPHDNMPPFIALRYCIVAR